MDNLYSSFVQYIPELITATFSIIVSIFFFSKKSNRERDFFVKKELNEILKIAIEYPYLEDEKFISDWNNVLTNGEDKVTRYELYATMIFNYLERLYLIYNGKENKISDFIDVKDWVNTHRKYWTDSNLAYENYSGYNKKFSNYINHLLKIN